MPSSVPAPRTDSAVLLLRARRGDARALAWLVEDLLPRLTAWARGRLPSWVRRACDTSDLVHDVFARTLGRLDVFEPRSRRALAAYLRAAVRNRIADEHRRAARWVVSDAGELTSPAPSPLDLAIGAETARQYRAALATLTHRERALVIGHLELDYSHAQLGCMIGRSPNAARMALARALARLAARMAAR